MIAKTVAAAGTIHILGGLPGLFREVAAAADFHYYGCNIVIPAGDDLLALPKGERGRWGDDFLWWIQSSWSRGGHPQVQVQDTLEDILILLYSVERTKNRNT
jgi:hypothetical protein